MTNYTWCCAPLLWFTATCLGLVTALHVSSYILILIDASGLGFELKHLCQQSEHADGSLTRSTLPIQNYPELIGIEWTHFKSAHSLLYHSKIAYRNVLWQLIPVAWKKVTFLCRALAAKDFGVAACHAKMLPAETLIQCATGHKSCSPGC